MNPTSPALARTTDPRSSLRGADHIENSGKLSTQCQQIYEALKLHPMHTARELAIATGIDYYLIQKRIAILNRRGLAVRRGERLCTISKSGIPVTVWEAV